MLRAGRCEFELEYSIKGDHKDEFLKLRNNFIAKQLKPISDIYEYYSYVPGDPVTVCGRTYI